MDWKIRIKQNMERIEEFSVGSNKIEKRFYALRELEEKGFVKLRKPGKRTTCLQIST